MATVVTEEKVQIRFTITEDDGTTFTDAIYLDQAEREKLEPAELEALQLERHRAWKEAVATPAPVVVRDEAAEAKELLAMRESIEAQLDAVAPTVLAAAKLEMGIADVKAAPAQIIEKV